MKQENNFWKKIKDTAKKDKGVCPVCGGRIVWKTGGVEKRNDMFCSDNCMSNYVRSGRELGFIKK